MSFSDVIFEGIARRKEAIAESRASGRFGAERLPLAVVSDSSLSDTAIQQCYVALREGRQQRQDDLYRRWLVENADRLADSLQETNMDGALWLRLKYEQETGRVAP